MPCIRKNASTDDVNAIPAILLTIIYILSNQIFYPAVGYNKSLLHQNGIANQLAYEMESNGLFSDSDRFFRREVVHRAAERGRAFRTKLNTPTVRGIEADGMEGYYAGPKAILVDYFALGDSLLARLPATNYYKWPTGWRPGHFRRSFPKGYLHARKTGNISKMHPAMRKYYRKLRLVISGPLFIAN